MRSVYVIENQTNIHHTGQPLYLCTEPYKRYLVNRELPFVSREELKIRWTKDFKRASLFKDFREATMNKIFVDHRFFDWNQLKDLKRLKRKVKIRKHKITESFDCIANS